MGSLSRIKHAVKILFNVERLSRGLNVFEDDTYLVSYPKSGNTWVRFLVGNLISDSPVGFSNIEEIVPDIYLHSQSFLQQRRRKARVLKSHEYFDPRYRRVIYVVRDPRDVVVSYFHHHQKFNLIEESFTLSDFVSGFIDGHWDSYGSWGENVGSWVGARKQASTFLIIRYEDLILDPLVEMQKIAAHLDIERTDEELMDAINNSSFENMKSLELEQGDKWKPLQTTRKDKAFVRKGEIGGWRNTLSDDDVAAIESAWCEVMREFHYLAGTNND